MPSITYKPAASWNASNRHTAISDQDILLSNVSSDTIRFEITVDDATPVLDAALGHSVQPGRSIAMQLKSGERLWLVGDDAQATVLVG